MSGRILILLRNDRIYLRRRSNNIEYRISVFSDLVATNRHLEIRGEHIVVRLASLINAICRQSGLRIPYLALSRYVNSHSRVVALETLSRSIHVSTLSNRCQIIIQFQVQIIAYPSLALLETSRKSSL